MIDVQRVTTLPGHPDDADLALWARTALAHLDVAGDLALRVVDEAESQTLNSRYRGKNAPTNVLSFPQSIPADVGEILLGDIVICAPLVANEARAQGKTLAAHYAHLVVHGVLHLCGYDHIDDDQAQRMEELECTILARLDVADPYLSPIDPDIHESSLRTA